MAKISMGHLQININPQNDQFYKDLFAFCGWKVLYEEPGVLGVGDEKGTSLWFVPATHQVKNDYDGPGMNHLALSVDQQSGVDDAVAYLKEKGIESLFETPRHRPDFSPDPEETYYQVMFKSPDDILFEIVYTGPLAK